jgi:hypothetical protein
MRRLNVKELASGLLLIVIGAFFAWSGRGLTVESAGQMGPGYFPLVLSVLMMLFGIIVLAGSFRLAATSFGPVPWRGIALLISAFVVFGATVRPAGLGPALAGAVLLASLASRRWRLLPSLILTAAMVLFCWAVFIWGLRLPVRFIGTWFQ